MLIALYSIYIQEINDIWFAVAFGANKKIIASAFSRGGRSEVIAGILDRLPAYSSFFEAKSGGAALDVLKKMYHIYNGKSVKIKFSLDMDTLPPFTKRVLLLTCKIPRGYVATYRGIAKALGNSGAARAVGQAEASNPFAPIIPCHRVVSSGLGLHGYGGGLDVKRAILKREGVVFKGKLVSKQSLWVP